jgi:hypothetical protein
MRRWSGETALGIPFLATILQPPIGVSAKESRERKNVILRVVRDMTAISWSRQAEREEGVY